ncbi:VOC family protein [Aurantiacibacter sp. MUD11]|uniref:VOC family protein n=1 Tax=Aurantiacibacter sp. MUD11 TaxID=3003265 RepID=UPI0022AA00B7|nr:VOC family protein [Aurantiacibacter sp. MUD11]WAT18521.1 VOC family protein [Aurantiacibacter sp. MUD11]
MAVLDYVELPVSSAKAETAFYSKAFGWNFTAYGDDYAAHEEAPCQLGLNGTGEHHGRGILPVIRVDDIAAALAAVEAAGGAITLPIFDFPGGKRFHFTDPEGLELACYEPAAG